MAVKNITEIIEAVNSVSQKIKEIPKEDFSKLLDEELNAVQKDKKKEEIKMFVQSFPTRNIVFEEEK